MKTKLTATILTAALILAGLTACGEPEPDTTPVGGGSATPATEPTSTEPDTDQTGNETTGEPTTTEPETTTGNGTDANLFSEANRQAAMNREATLVMRDVEVGFQPRAARLGLDGEFVLRESVIEQANSLDNTFIIIEVFVATCLDDLPSRPGQGLSERRAQSVVDHLVSQGIDENRLIPVGRGISQPLEPCTGRGNCCASSRRVYFSFVPAT